jgi:hypothetical protein
VAVTSSVSLSHFNHLVATRHPFPAAFTSGSRWAFWVCVGIAAVGLIATLTLIRRDELAPETEPASAPAF